MGEFTMRQLRNQKGLTLAELLAVIAISSFVMILISSVLIFVQKQYTSQSASTSGLTDIKIAAQAITKDIRSYDIDSVDSEEKEIRLTNGRTYKYEEGYLKRDGANYLYDLKDFEITKSGGKIELKIESNTGQILETEIYVREGDDT